MPRKKNGRPLLLRVMAELGKGRISEGYLKDGKLMTDGITSGKHIHINPAHQTIDTLIHECLHRMAPHWGESYTRNRTTFIRRRMTDDEIQAVYRLYNEVKRTRKRPLDVTER